MGEGTQLGVIRGGKAASSPAEPAELDQIFRQYASYVATIGFKILGRSDELDDLVQDVFIEAMRGLRQLREPGALKGWLARITVRRAVRSLRRARVLAFFGLEAPPETAEIASAAATAEGRAQVALVYRLLERLPAAERAVWVLRHAQGESLDDIAVICACSKSTVQRRLRSAQKTIERRMSHARND
jgi:RNA polymerase sigma-70 factor, ECF subfamily